MSLILLQSEKQIKPGLLDSSDRPEDFVNIFRKPIQIRDNQTIELVSMSYNKQGNITVNTTNDTLVFRVGDIKNYLNKTVKVKQGTYTQAAFAIQLAQDLNNANILNQYVWSVTISGTFIYVTLNQDSKLFITNDGRANSSNLTLPMENSSVYATAKNTRLDLSRQVLFGNTIYATSPQVRTSIAGRILDEFDKLYYANLFPKPLFSNAPILRTEVYPQFHITGLTTAAIGKTFTSGTDTGNLAAYTGSNLYDSQVTLGAVTYYIKYGSSFTGSIKNISDTEIVWYQRGELLIVSKSDIALPSAIDKTIDLTNFGLNGLSYDRSRAANLPVTGTKSFGRTVKTFDNFYGVSFVDITVQNLNAVLSFTTVGYNNSSIGLYSKTTWGEAGARIDPTNSLMDADYSLSLEQSGKTVGTTNTKVLLKCLKGNTSSNAPVGFFYKLGASPENPTAVTEIDLEAIAGITTSGSSMDNLRLKLGTLAGVKSRVIFSLEKESGVNMWIGVLTGRFEAENELTEDFYPLYGAIASSPGSYGQALGTTSSNVFSGTFNTRAYTPTAKNLKELGVIDPDNATDNSAPVEGAAGATKQKLSFFIRFGIVPESSISADNSAGTNFSLINIQDVQHQGAEITRNKTSNTADINLIMNQNVFSRYNEGSNDTYYGMTTGPIISNDYLNENINVQLPDFPIRSFNGLLGQPENCVAIVPAEQIKTDAVTGRLYHAAEIPNKINMNNNGQQLVNHVRVRLTTPEGQPVTNLLHPTSIVLKIDDKS